MTPSLKKTSPALSSKLAASTDRRFQFQKRRKFFVCTHNEALSIAAMRVINEDRSPFTIHSCNTAPTPRGFAALGIVEDDLRVRLRPSRPLRCQQMSHSY
jgi:hypothetical protein